MLTIILSCFSPQHGLRLLTLLARVTASLNKLGRTRARLRASGARAEDVVGVLKFFTVSLFSLGFHHAEEAIRGKPSVVGFSYNFHFV